MDLDHDGTPIMSDLKPIVYVVDDDTAVRQHLARLILAAGWEPALLASASHFASQPCTPRPSCLILDVMLPELNARDLRERISRDQPDMPILFVTDDNDVPPTVRAIKARGIEFVAKPFDDRAVLWTIRSALERSQRSREAARDLKRLRDRFLSLSRRERDVMGLVISGLMNREMGAELGISEITVKAHRGRMMRKMQAGSLVELIDIAGKLGVPRERRFRPPVDRDAAGAGSSQASHPGARGLEDDALRAPSPGRPATPRRSGPDPTGRQRLPDWVVVRDGPKRVTG